MAGLFASLAVRRALDTLTSFLPASLVASSSSGAARAREEQDLEDLRMLERTMRRIHATLNDAEQLWDIREETTKLQLKELKELAYDMEDVVDEYEYEVNRCKVEALELSASAASNKRKHQTWACP
uniref:Disease resistance N-terminal domain-containing protein n=1 Tax=Oryza glumipatula TaxID=40148 RepID=A0A0E0BJ82_9ORYZ